MNIDNPQTQPPPPPLLPRREPPGPFDPFRGPLVCTLAIAAVVGFSLGYVAHLAGLSL